MGLESEFAGRLHLHVLFCLNVGGKSPVPRFNKAPLHREFVSVTLA